jgi:acylphosphatase
MNEKTLQINISGRIQGVGFRACVRRIAFDLHVSGMVMNLQDGRVQIYATGDPIILEKLVSMLYGCPRAQIRDIRVIDVNFQRFEDFTIIKGEGRVSTGL